TTTSDTEVIAHLIVREHIKTNNLVAGIRNAMGYLKGSYSLTMLFEDKIIAVRDPYGVRPLVYGRSGDTHVFASETCALDVLNVDFVRDVKPSEILVIGDKVESHMGVSEKVAHCMFEYVYFARPDSVLDGRSVYEVRKNLGAVLSREGKVKADLVVPVPDSGITQAIGYSRESKIPFGEGLMKNRYIGRTFILPDQEKRDVSVKVKLNPIRSELKGRGIVLVDDSIVRGTTIKKLIRLLKDAGAKKVHVRVSCPPLRSPCFYGIDMQSRKEFIAAKKTVDEIKREIGADSLVYTSIKGLIEAIGLPATSLCMACLNDEYPIKDVQTKL
ncbi:MAG: amidophosphoribosyltransferase, partial [Candidatus Altiarchaeales archaeon]|nr:amidophosphoribosyltransferase [Candidatus Altiarchaeales archaeon]